MSRQLPLLAVAYAVVLAVALAACDSGRPPLEFDPDSLPAGAVGSAYQADITVSRNVTPVGGASVAPGTLPPGLTLELVPGGSDTARISGTPTTAGTFEFTVSVWCFGTNVSGQAGEQRYTITVT